MDPAQDDMPKLQSKSPSRGQAESTAEVVPDTLTPAQNRRIFIKTNCIVLVIMMLASFIAFLDKNAMSFAAVYGMSQEIHLVGQDYSWLSSIFYFGYLAMEIPAMWLLTKVPIGKFVGIVLMLWGVAICSMAGCTSFATMATARFFLGVLEASLLPCCILLTSMWYRREEHAIISGLYFNTFAGIFGGILAYAIGHIQGSLSAWKYLFIIYGSVTLAFGLIVVLVLPDSPSKAWFFTAEEKNFVALRLAENETSINSDRSWKWAQVVEILKDPKYWVLAVSVMAFAVTNAGITNFNPLIISGYGFSETKTTLMAAPQAAVAMVAQTVATLIMLYMPNMRCLLWSASMLPAIAGTVMIHVLDIEAHRTASLIGVYLLGFYNLCFVTILSLQSSNVSGRTKKPFASVSVAIFYSVGNIIGPQFFLERQAPYYTLGISAMMTAFSLNAVMGMLYFTICVLENKRRDRIHGKPSTAVHLDAEASDLTDVENVHFRYSF